MISVIIPVYNGEKYLGDCLASVSGKDSEIIVIDDASTDNSTSIAKKWTDKIISVPHAGPVVARNIGIQAANGEYLLFMDADDILASGAIQDMLNQIDDNDVLIGLRQDFVSDDCKTHPTQTNKKSNHGVISGCALIKKTAFDIVGLFDEDILCGDGYDWILRAQESGAKIKKSDSVFCMRRIHDSNMGRTLKDREYSDYCKIIKKHFVKK